MKCMLEAKLYFFSIDFTKNAYAKMWVINGLLATDCKRRSKESCRLKFFIFWGGFGFNYSILFHNLKIDNKKIT